MNAYYSDCLFRFRDEWHEGVIRAETDSDLVAIERMGATAPYVTLAAADVLAIVRVALEIGEDRFFSAEERAQLIALLQS